MDAMMAWLNDPAFDALLPQIDRFQKLAASEKPGQRKTGRPDLAHGANNTDIMGVGVDAAYTKNFDPASHEGWQMRVGAGS